MRSLISALVISASLAAQYTGEAPYLYTNPPVLDARFSGPALGVAGAIAQIEFTPMRDATGALVPNQFYITATWINGTNYSPHAAVYNASTNVITPRPGDVAALGLDGFACNVSNDLLVVCWDTGGSTQPVVASRTNTSLPFSNVVSVGAPVPAGYRDSTIFDKDPTTPNRYQFGYFAGRTLRYAMIDITTGAVTSAETTTVSEASIDVHSQLPMRQQTGNFFDIGKTRAMMYSKNTSSADSFFRSSVADLGSLPVPNFMVYDDTGWKANPGNMGGEIYWAYAPTGYGNPQRQETLCCSSSHVAPGGGVASIVAWSKTRTAAPIFGTIVIGGAGLAAAGIDLSFMGVRGKLGLNPASLLFLPLQPFDNAMGEIGYDIPVSINQPTTIHYQVLAFDTATSRIFLGNTAQLDVR